MTASEIVKVLENRSKAKRFERDEREFYAALAAILKTHNEQIRDLQTEVAKLKAESES